MHLLVQDGSFVHSRREGRTGRFLEAVITQGGLENLPHSISYVRIGLCFFLLRHVPPLGKKTCLDGIGQCSPSCAAMVLKTVFLPNVKPMRSLAVVTSGCFPAGQKSAELEFDSLWRGAERRVLFSLVNKIIDSPAEVQAAAYI